MSQAISSWVAHATREPATALLEGMNDWWLDMPVGQDPLARCPWLSSPLHRLVLVHVDRAAHKRRHLPTFVCATTCNLTDHGTSPVADMVRDDTYGTKPITISHVTEGSPLANAISLARGNESGLTVGVVSEPDFEDPEEFDAHRSILVNPARDGVALAVIHVAMTAKETADDEAAREDLLRATGYSMYQFDLRAGDDPKVMHRKLAILLEDVFDEIVQIKADAAARILMNAPLWPALVLRTTPEWRAAHPSGVVSPVEAGHG